MALYILEREADATGVRSPANLPALTRLGTVTQEVVAFPVQVLPQPPFALAEPVSPVLPNPSLIAHSDFIPRM